MNHRGYKRLSFADNVREAVYRLNPRIERRIFSDYDDDRFIYTPVQALVDKWGWEYVKVNFGEARRLLQVMGTEVGRSMFGEDAWIEMVGRQVKEINQNIGVIQDIVITDVRFQNEADYVRKLGGRIVLITREGTGPVNDHASDKIDFDADMVIQNDGSIGGLTDYVLALDSSGWSSS